MGFFRFLKNILKRIFPPPTRSFMREVGFLKREHTELSNTVSKWGNELQKKLDRMARDNEARIQALEKQLEKQNEQLDRLYSLFESANRENLRLYFDARAERDEFGARYNNLCTELQNLTESSKAAFAGFDKELQTLHTLQTTTDFIKARSLEASKYASEAVWGEVFNSSIEGCEWLTKRTFSPGRWALGYQAMYALFRALNNARPERILELGLGQSTRLTAQYAAANPAVEHYVVEHDPEWIAFFQREYQLSDRTRIVQFDLEFRAYKEADAVRVFSKFKETFQGMRFDLIVIDAPLGGDMPLYARIDILELLPDCLSDRFVIMMDDVERSGESNTSKEICAALEQAGVPFVKGYYHGAKSLILICSESLSFLTSM